MKYVRDFLAVGLLSGALAASSALAGCPDLSGTYKFVSHKGNKGQVDFEEIFEQGEVTMTLAQTGCDRLDMTLSVDKDENGQPVSRSFSIETDDQTRNLGEPSLGQLTGRFTFTPNTLEATFALAIGEESYNMATLSTAADGNGGLLATFTFLQPGSPAVSEIRFAKK